MTVKEIAELCGVEVHTVRNWINKDDFLKENFTLRKWKGVYPIHTPISEVNPIHPLVCERRLA
jgi:predicted transcriptional regulator